MRYALILILSMTFLFSCKNETQSEVQSKKSIEKKSISYPAALTKMFDAHGGLDTWNEMKSMSYEIVREGGNEKQLIDLENRNEELKVVISRLATTAKNIGWKQILVTKGMQNSTITLCFTFMRCLLL